jgi:lysyl-tRNA synthetase class 2
MKPEKRIASDVILNDEEKAVLAIIEKIAKIDLNELKSLSGLSNKKWDKTIKGLTKNNVAKVSKTDDGLFVEII